MRGRCLFTLGASFGLAVLLVGCSHGNAPQIPLGTSTISMTIHDTPPAGVAVLSFEVTVTGVALNPVAQGIGSSGSGPISLLNGDAPVDVELTQLVTDSAFLAVASAPEGTYQNLTLAFYNPRLTILNNSGAAVGSCANGAVCGLTPALNQNLVTVPFSSGASSVPLTLSPNTQVGLDIDFNLGQSIQSDLSITPAVTVSQLPQTFFQQGQTGFTLIDNVEGQVSTVGFRVLSLKTASGQTLTVSVDDNTQYGGFTASSGVTAGQTVLANTMLQIDGTLLAYQLQLQQSPDEAQQQSLVVGLITSVDSATQFHMVVHDTLQPVAGVQIGNLVKVTIQGGATFTIEPDGLTVPSRLSFAGPSDLMIGQEVQLSIAGSSASTDLTTGQITLRMSQITGTVSANASTTNFTLGSLPALFTSSGITAMQAVQVPETTLENLDSVPVSQTVAVRGLLYNTTGAPTLVAGKIANRPSF